MSAKGKKTYPPTMKALLVLISLTVSLLAAAPVEIPVESGQRKALFDLLRPQVAKQAGIAAKEVKFQGSFKQQGNWAFFGGRSLDAQSQSLLLEPLGNDDTCALFLKTFSGWVLVDWSAGHSDVFYVAWVDAYGVKPELLSLQAD